MDTHSLEFGSAKFGIVQTLAHKPVILSPYVLFVHICVQLPVLKSEKYPTVQLFTQLLVTDDLKYPFAHV